MSGSYSQQKDIIAGSRKAKHIYASRCKELNIDPIQLAEVCGMDRKEFLLWVDDVMNPPQDVVITMLQRVGVDVAVDFVVKPINEVVVV